ncbi:unnamed protein product [Trichobilharzia regenti]|nr:unnamed protein product [Trichobilharzia regenti]
MVSGLKTYKYSCVDNSPFSTYIMHPFWDWLSQFYPVWLAPNLITFTGFLLTVAHYFLTCFYNPNFSATNNVPVWVWLVTSFLVFIAHTLDGTDGKQARRTKSSSALGELFDHGCDSWVCLFLPGSMFSLLGDVYTTREMFIGQWVLIVSFLLSHWEKYITGVLFLPWTFDTSQTVSNLFFIYLHMLIFVTKFYECYIQNVCDYIIMIWKTNRLTVSTFPSSVAYIRISLPR